MRTRNWYNFLTKKDLEQREDSEIYAATIAAGEWEHCAIGERAKILAGMGVLDPIVHDPLDPTLRRLGLNFSSAINSRSTKRALTILSKIDARIRELAKGRW